MSKVIVNNKVKEVITLNNLLPHFHLQKYLPLFQKHNIDLKIFLTMNEQNLQSIGIKDETHRKILLICIQKIPEILTAKEVKDPMILITHDNEINNVINADDSSSDDCYESEENQSEDDDRTTIATFEEETVVPTTKVIKEEGNDDVIDNGIDNDIDNDSDNENDIDNDISNDIDNDIDNDIENDACNEVDAIEQYENRRLMETIKEGDSDNEIVRREVESDVINSLPDIDVINSLPDIDEIPNDSPPPYSSPYSSPYSPPSQGQITTTSLSFKNVIKKSSSFWKNRKQSYENILSNRLARDRNKGYKLPSYSESLSCEEEQEELPGYSCSVDKAGYLMKKNEMISDEQKANVRSWGKIYFYLWGTFVKIYKSEPNNIKRASPICQFSMNGAKVSIALDYSKKRNVLRIRLLNGRSYLFQAPDRCEFISWIEKLQSSANISSTIDEREMPMFITLPTRRRRGSQQQQLQLQEEVAATTRTTISSVIRTRARSTFGNSRNNNGINSRSSSRSSSSGSNNSRMLMSITTSGLTYQHFNDLARDLQLVQVVDVLPQQQLLW